MERNIILLQPGQLQIGRASQRNTWFYHIRDGYHYHRNASGAAAAYLKCVQYERGCHGRAIYHRRVRRFEISQPHDHDPDPLYVSESKLRRRILDRCVHVQQVSFKQIVDEETRRFPRDVRRRVTLARMRPAMQRQRKSMFPPPPVTLQDLARMLQRPQNRIITMTSDGEDNMFAGSVIDGYGHHHVIFASRRMLRFARRLKLMFSDGTFKTTPAGMDVYQIFTIVTNWRNHIIPIAWVLMERKTQVAYAAVLRMLRLFLLGAPHLRRVVTDFERAMQNAWSDVFHERRLILQGCFFHFVYTLLRYAKNVLHMAALLRGGASRLIFRLCCALPLLPERYIQRGFHIILREARGYGRNLYRRLRPFFAYMTRYWINNAHRRQWMCVFGSIHRTNNSSESCNRMLSLRLKGLHANLYNFIAAIVSMEDVAFTDIDVLQAGGNPSRRRKSSAIANDLRIQRLSEDLLNPPGPLNHAIYFFLNAAVYTFENVYNDMANE